MLSAIYIGWHAGSPEALNRYPGLPAFSLSFTWVVLFASELLREECTHESRVARRRVASAALAVAAWLVLIPAQLVYGATIFYTAWGIAGILGCAVLFALVAGFVWTINRYSGPARRRPGR